MFFFGNTLFIQFGLNLVPFIEEFIIIYYNVILLYLSFNLFTCRHMIKYNFNLYAVNMIALLNPYAWYSRYAIDILNTGMYLYRYTVRNAISVVYRPVYCKFLINARN